ncbi:hypothetical protein ASPWEDRAFT_170896 [Aspergillus wentii DTO 134E9]|uniref:Magnesium chelatase n=1 Tax=Aspergillus wentii DTO 134E9 TaxID=1073089 RepID=A0A1L9RR60_ASPWE|nr:uncharacterized protein ASPWEDRAFT_170896 [Aspergillus wentii DTO 134E9]KAI9928106.1 hypothetical protein MW887_002139 [Aspergillus wentii]OJJ37414.1 hypothetical protein ASPWEDRAFT_170896 [Aspergillus wentii DTO 134E9]
MENWDFSDLALELSDLEVALFLCLVAREHCLIETTDDCIHDVAKELALICSHTFGLSYKILDCSSATSFDDFCNEVLALDVRKDHIPSLDRKDVANVVIAKNFDQANDFIQVQALELMRSKKLVVPDGVLTAPTDFLIVPLVVHSSDQLQLRFNMHLNEHLFISHFHGPGDGYAHLEDGNGWLSDGQMSASSVVHKPETQGQKSSGRVDQELLDRFRETTDSVTFSADVFRYQQDIVIFLRLSRAVAGGISAKVNSHFTQFSKLLASLHGLDYLTPSIVALAARKVFRHQIIVARPEDDRSLEYGSDYEAVSQVLIHVNPETILDSVLALEAPL